MGFAWVYFMIWPVGHCGASMCLKRSISLKNDVRMGFAWPFKDVFFCSHGFRMEGLAKNNLATNILRSRQ